MNALLNLLRNIDEAVFKQIDSFKDSKYYEQLMDFMGGLTETNQKIFRYFISGLCILPPIVVVFILAINVWILEGTVSTKKEIQNTVHRFINQKDRLSSLQRKVLSPRAPRSKRDLKASLKSINVAQNKLTVTNFKQKTFKNAPKIKQINADILFKKITLSDFTEILNKLIRVNKVRISGVEVNRSKKDKMLSGKISILQYAKK